MTEIDLTVAQKKFIIATIRNRFPSVRIVAFGSRVAGTAKPHSDLDVALIADEKLDLKLWALLEDDFSRSDFPFKVDVVDYARVTAAFRKIIDETGVVW